MIFFSDEAQSHKWERYWFLTDEDLKSKLRVWVAISAQGIIEPYFFENMRIEPFRLIYNTVTRLFLPENAIF